MAPPHPTPGPPPQVVAAKVLTGLRDERVLQAFVRVRPQDSPGEAGGRRVAGCQQAGGRQWRPSAPLPAAPADLWLCRMSVPGAGGRHPARHAVSCAGLLWLLCTCQLQHCSAVPQAQAGTCFTAPPAAPPGPVLQRQEHCGPGGDLHGDGGGGPARRGHGAPVAAGPGCRARLCRVPALAGGMAVKHGHPPDLHPSPLLLKFPRR